MRAVLVLVLCLPATALAQVRTSDASLAGSASAALGYVAEVGWSGPAIGVEIATRAVGASAALTFPGDETSRALSLSASVYPGGRMNPVALAVGAELDVVHGSTYGIGRSVVLAGPVAAVSYRLIHSPRGSVIPEAIVGLLVPAGYDSRQARAGLQVGAAARVTLAAPSAFGGARAYLTPAVSRSVNLDRSYDRATYALSIEAGITGDL